MLRRQQKQGSKVMTFRTILLGVVAIGLAGGALAGEDTKIEMKIAVMDGEGDDGVNFTIDSDNLDFDLAEMQEGESRSIIDAEGRSILITRQGYGYTFNIDGETIELPGLMGDEHHGMVWVGEGDGSDVDVHVLRDSNFKMMHDTDETMIVSPKPIDEATQQAIKSLLESAGYGSEVNFVDRSDAHGGNVMIKKVERISESPQT